MNVTSKRIKELREAHNMSPVELANKVGTSKSSLYRYENGEIDKMPTKVINNIANYFNVSPLYLLGMTDCPTIETQRQSTENEIVTLVQSMSEDEKQMLLKIIRGMKS